MARAAAIMTEADPGDVSDDDGYVPAPGAAQVPEGLSDRANGGGGHQNGHPQAQQAPEVEYEMIDADDNLRPIEADRQSQQDQRLVEERDPGTYVERQQRDQRTAAEHARETPVARRQRQRAARDKTLAELDAANDKIAKLEAVVGGFAPRFDQIDTQRLEARIADVDREIADAASRRAEAARRLQDAMTASDGAAFAEAMQARDDAVIAFTQATARKQILAAGGPQVLDQARTAMRQGAQAPPQQQRYQAAPVPRQQQRFTDDFLDQHNEWYDSRPQTRDPDTQIARLIDSQVAADGFNPSTQDYWDELNDRLRERLPHRFAAEQAQQDQRTDQQRAAPRRQAQQPARQQPAPEQRGPRVSGGSDRAGPSGNRAQVHISPQRKQAMIDTGVLDRDGRTVVNPEKFRRQMKAFSDFDRQNGANA